eukprot:scaffold2516_cov108-Isochrysis_galbana.AAC.17
MRSMQPHTSAVAVSVPLTPYKIASAAVRTHSEKSASSSVGSSVPPLQPVACTVTATRASTASATYAAPSQSTKAIPVAAISSSSSEDR